MNKIEEENNLKDTYRIHISNTDQWKKYLEENGYVVVTSLLSENECSEYLSKLWKAVEILSEGKVSFEDKSTWEKAKNYPFMLHGGMVQYIGHAQFQWDLRERCSELFAKLWNVDKTKLASSFDGFCLMNGTRKYLKKQINSFLHSDQSPLKDKLWSYQGAMCLTDNNDDKSGGFVCVPKSNLCHQKFFTENFNIKDKKFKEDWYLFSDDVKTKYKSILGNFTKINNKAGDFILWDSRTFHCNCLPTQEVLRACTYICMIPKSHIPDEIKIKRKKAFDEKRCSTHHPGDGFRVFPKHPRFGNTPDVYKKLIAQAHGKLILSDLQLSLAYID